MLLHFCIIYFKYLYIKMKKIQQNKYFTPKAKK